jgi:hypothetical protein
MVMQGLHPRRMKMVPSCVWVARAKPKACPCLTWYYKCRSLASLRLCQWHPRVKNVLTRNMEPATRSSIFKVMLIRCAAPAAHEND